MFYHGFYVFVAAVARSQFCYFDSCSLV